MTSKAQIIAIAETLGWRGIREHNLEPHHLIGMYGPERAFVPVPDFLGDLNAMHEAEMTLNKDQLWEFASRLSCVMDNAPRRFKDMAWEAHQVSATAPQRVEAILRATRRWKDDV